MTFDKSEVDTLVIGAGQAGVATSEHLGKLGVPYLVVERDRIAEAWRTGRWDSLVANGPAWHDRFPGLEFDGLDPDAFASKDQVAEYFEAYARKFNAPVRTGVEVQKVQRNADRPGFTIETSDGVIVANHVVVATGPFQRPLIRRSHLKSKASARFTPRLDLPLEPEARAMLGDPDCVTHPILELDLAGAGVTTIIWATGYTVDYSWLKVDAFKENGKPQHQRGVSAEPGVYFVGLPWQSRRGSAFIWGVWHDAKHIADHIVKQRAYLAYRDASQRQAEALKSALPVQKASLMGVR